MLYQDRIYGKTKISDPLVLELIACPEMQRLKEIDQIGYFEPFFPGTKHSRFEHSLGVYILLSIYKASREEQIAGLIHDVSHSAFSHCIDYVLEDGSPEHHDHQDNVFRGFILRSSIPSILKKHKIDADLILDDKNFPLKEKDLPELCADRIDYSLRTGVIYEELSRQELDGLLENLIAADNNWAFKGYKSARDYAELFCRLNAIYYSGAASAIMFQTVGDCLKYALKKKYINKKDLYLTDKDIIGKIKEKINSDAELNKYWNRMNNKVEVILDNENYDAEVVCKSRIVDPLFLHNSELRKVSDVDSDWKDVVEKEMQPKKYRLKFRD